MVHKTKWKRNKKEENGNVYKWFEKGDLTVTLVEGYFPDEANIRVTSSKFEPFEIRGHKSLILKLTDEELLKSIDRLLKSIDRHIKRRIMFETKVKK